MLLTLTQILNEFKHYIENLSQEEFEQLLKQNEDGEIAQLLRNAQLDTSHFT